MYLFFHIFNSSIYSVYQRCWQKYLNSVYQVIYMHSISAMFESCDICHICIMLYFDTKKYWTRDENIIRYSQPRFNIWTPNILCRRNIEPHSYFLFVYVQDVMEEKYYTSSGLLSLLLKGWFKILTPSPHFCFSTGEGVQNIIATIHWTPLIWFSFAIGEGL